MVHGLVAAANRGVRLINASFGEFRAATDQTLMEAVDVFLNGLDSLVIAAAGNENTKRPLFPAASTYSLAVGGVGVDSRYRWNPADPRTGSNHGPWVDIAAPAEEVFTTQPTAKTTAFDPGVLCFDYATPGYPLLTTLAERRAKGCYSTVSGTSLATPMVVGVAGMVLERYPHYNALEVRKRLEETAVPRTSILARGLGNGLLHAQQAVFNGSFEAAEVQSRALMGYAGSLETTACAEWIEVGGGWWPLYEPCQRPGAYQEQPSDHGWHLIRYGGIPYQPFNHVHSVQALAGTMIRRLGPIVPEDGRYMAMLSTGRAAETYESIHVFGDDYWTANYLDILEQTFTIAPGQNSIKVSFMYDFVTEEQPHVADRGEYPDADFFSAVIEFSDRREVIVFRHMWEMEDLGALTLVNGLRLVSRFPVRHTGWKPVEVTYDIDAVETGPVTIRFAISDGTHRDLDSILLIDDVRIE
jgi:hypothetical protein